MDLHNYSTKAENSLKNIVNSESISQENVEDIKKFVRWLKTKRRLSSARICRYLNSAKKVLEYKENDFRLKTAPEEDIEKVVGQIEDSDYYSKEYSPNTKHEFRKFLRNYFKWSNGGDKVPEKARFISGSLSEKEKKKVRTSPKDLPGPKEIKHMAQSTSNLRNKALIMTHWDLGARIGETMNIQLKDYWEEDNIYYIRVHGNKSSPDRTCRVDIAYPTINRWLDKRHPNPDDPEAYLFCRITASNVDNPSNSPVSYTSVRKAFNIGKEDLNCKTNTHAIRKARISFLSKLKMPERAIDKRVGHIPGSDVTREYTRLSDSDVNQNYSAVYGNGKTKKEVRDLEPLKCTECGSVNSGHRDRCHNCNSLLDINEVKQIKDKSQEVKDLLYDVLEEKGLLQEITDKIEID